MKVALLSKKQLPQVASVCLEDSSSVYLTVSEVIELVAPSIHADKEVTIGGLTWDGSRDGTPLGTSTIRRISGKRQGTHLCFELEIPAFVSVSTTLMHA